MRFTYECAAMNGEEMPDGLSQWEQYTFLSLRSLYKQLRAGIINLDVAISEKRLIEKAADTAKRKAEFSEKHIASIVDLWKTIEVAGREYAKEPSVKHADEFYKAVYGVGRKHRKMNENPEKQ